MSNHVEVLRHMKETIKAIMPSEVEALDAAIAALSAPQPPSGGEFRALAERAVPFLRDEGDKYADDGSNEPLELAREIEHALASPPPVESALPPANSAFDGGGGAALTGERNG